MSLSTLFSWQFVWSLDGMLTIGTLLIFVYLFIKVEKQLFRLIIALYKANTLVYMKVVLPRSDSKLDKEKETKKDFKETVSVMQQLYRAIYEIKELNFKNWMRSVFLGLDRVSFELYLDQQKLYFYVVTYPYYQTIIEKQITSFYPDAEIILEQAPKLFEPGYDVLGQEIFLKKEYWYPILSYKQMEEDPLNDLANVMSKVTEDERAAVQFLISPKSNKWRKTAKQRSESFFKGKGRPTASWRKIPLLGFIGGITDLFVTGNTDVLKTNAPGAQGGDSYVRMLQVEEELAKRMGEKASQEGYDVNIRIFAASKGGEQKVEDLLNNMIVGFNIFNDANGNGFQNRMSLFHHARMPLLYLYYRARAQGLFQRNAILTPEELATIYHFPNSVYNKTPVIHWQSYKVLPPPPNLPDEGLLLGLNVYRGVKNKVYIKREDRTRHMYMIGKSGTGKSTQISYMVRQDIWNGDGVGLIDPHGDLVEDVLCYVPKSRARDVIVFDPSDAERPMGLNILEAKTDAERDRASLDATEIFIKLFGDEIFGPRIQHYFRNACLTLMSDEEEGATLIDVPRVFTDEEFMKYKVSKVKNPVVKSFWDHEYAHTGAREREEMIPYFSAKFGPFITNSTMRNVIGQAKSAFNIREVMDNQKILLVNLSKGKIGGLNAQLLGLILVNKISMAAMSRVDTPEKDRKDFYLYVDEFQNFATDTFASILSEARKYRLALIMAHQYINQLVVSNFGKQSTQVRDAVFGNVGTMMSFKVGAEDAEYLSKEYAPVLSDQDIIGIANYKAYIKLNIDNATTRPFSMETIYDNRDKNTKVAEILKQYSSLKYGRKREFVDQEIEARLGITTAELEAQAVDPMFTTGEVPDMTLPPEQSTDGQDTSSQNPA